MTQTLTPTTGPAPDGDGRRPRPPASLTERTDFRVWTVTMIVLAFAALFAAVGALVVANDASSKAPKASASTALAPGQSIDFNATAPAGFKPRDPVAPSPLPGTVHDITLHIKEAKVAIAPGVKQTVWTFGGTVPGPVYRGKVGDTFNFTIVNDGKITHSMDFHAGMVSPSTAMVPIDPGKSHVYTFTANHAGIYMYHCGTPPVLMHIGMGMYGAVIIDPPNLPKVDHEYVLLQSDLYTGRHGAPADLAKMTDEQYDAVVFNGYVNQYKLAPIRTEPGQRVRVWILDDGPSQSSSFHVIGTIFDTVYKEGSYLLGPAAGPGGSQALDLMPAQGGFVEFTPAEAGSYAFVTHKFNDASRGAVGVFQVGDMPVMAHS
ncbi:MAG: multicopper oxidase domain-containing protein [Acidimicrobiia bacterium]